MRRILDHPILAEPKDRIEVPFTFDGESLVGYEGETIAAALTANGVSRFSTHWKDGTPQGLFCANGQCSQCAVVVDGAARKACVYPLGRSMDVRTLVGLPILPILPDRVGRVGTARGTARSATHGAAHGDKASAPRIAADVLVIGGGPAGIGASLELARLGLSVILADDKERLGGKLVLQTHKFFGSEADCRAGTRGIDIARELEDEVRAEARIRVMTRSPVVGVYKDRAAGIYEGLSSYVLAGFQGLVVAAGARERSVLFPGNDLVGVFGAGAFQTLTNRDLARPARRVLVVGSGNVGLIAAYHALQAGIGVAAIVEIAPTIGGYKVHADKIARLGVPILLSTAVVSVEGPGRVGRAVVARLGPGGRPEADSLAAFDVDAALVAAGLAPCDELYRQASAFGIPAVKAGDADEIAEASSALFGGRIAAFSLARAMGLDVRADPSWPGKRDVLKSKQGDRTTREPAAPGPDWRPVFHCDEEIPCDPCRAVCPARAIELRGPRGDIRDLPFYSGSGCTGCGSCVAVCPGLAIALARGTPDGGCEVVLPWELKPDVEPGGRCWLFDASGSPIEESELVRKRYDARRKTWLLTFKGSAAVAEAIGLRARVSEADRPAGAADRPAAAADRPAGAAAGLAGAAEGARPMPSAGVRPPEDAIVCRCERLTFGELVRFARENRVTDVNQLKAARAGMGACGSKTCGPLFAAVLRAAGVDPAAAAGASLRPLEAEVALGDVAMGAVAKGDAGASGAAR
jgi:sarcosine oxidase, subunit alpha